MFASAPSVHPSKKVVFAGWDSEEEGKRSARGIEFRRRLKEEKQQKKMAARQARADDLDLARRTYQALIEDSNRGPLDTLAQDQDNQFFFLLSLFYTNLRASPLGNAIHRRGERERTSVILGRIRQSGITFQQIQQHRHLVQNLLSIGGLIAIRDGFLTRREGHVSSEDDHDEEDQDPAQAQPQAPTSVRNALLGLGFTAGQVDQSFNALGDDAPLDRALTWLLANLQPAALPLSFRVEQHAGQRRGRDGDEQNERNVRRRR